MSRLTAPWLYRTVVTHTRRDSHAYRFRHRAFRLLLDADRMPWSVQGIRGLAFDRFAPVSVYNRDFGPRDGKPPRPWLERLLARAGIAAPARILLLCYPRLWGYQFNPLALWFCEDASGRPTAVVCEVHNTFGEAYSYVLRVSPSQHAGAIRCEKDKAFHVSPFIAMDTRYRFSITLDSVRLAVSIHETGSAGETILVAGERGTGLPLTSRSLLRCVVAMPLMTFRIWFFIRWHALLLWLRGAAWHRKPPPPDTGEGR